MSEQPWPSGLEFVGAIMAEARQAGLEAREPMTIAVTPAELEALKAHYGVQPAAPGPNRIAGVPVQVVDVLQAGIIVPPAPAPLFLAPERPRLEWP